MAGKVGDKWKVCILATDNPSLAAPKQDGAGHGSYSGGGKSAGYQKNDNLIVAQCAFKGVIDLVVADKIPYDDIGDETKSLFDLIMKIGAPSSISAAPEQTNEAPKEAHKEAAKALDNTAVLDALSKSDLLNDVVQRPNGLAQAIGIWNSCNGNVNLFTKTVMQTFGIPEQPADDNLPF
jgi:hypothetical protein